MATKEVTTAELRGDFEMEARYARTLGQMLFDLICADDDIPNDLPVNDPACRQQRMFATLEALRSRVENMCSLEARLGSLRIGEAVHG